MSPSIVMLPGVHGDEPAYPPPLYGVLAAQVTDAVFATHVHTAVPSVCVSPTDGLVGKEIVPPVVP